MKSLFWKKIETSSFSFSYFLTFYLEKQGKPPKIEEGLSLTYLIDKNQYIHFGNHKSLKSDSGSEVSFQKSTYFFFKITYSYFLLKKYVKMTISYLFKKICKNDYF